MANPSIEQGKSSQALSTLEFTYDFICNGSLQFSTMPDAAWPFFGGENVSEEQILQVLKQSVGLCYFKMGEQAAAINDYQKALDRFISAYGYEYEVNRTLVYIEEAIEKLSAVALSGDMEVLKRLMKIYDYGQKVKFVTSNKNKPAEVCLQLAEQGNPEATFLLAEYYSKQGGFVGLTDKELRVDFYEMKRSKQLYKRAIELGYDKKTAKKACREMVKDFHEGCRSKWKSFLAFVIATGWAMGAYILASQIFGEDSAIPYIVVAIAFFGSWILFDAVRIRGARIAVAVVVLLSLAGDYATYRVLSSEFSLQEQISTDLEEGKTANVIATPKIDGVNLLESNYHSVIQKLKKSDVLTVTGPEEGPYNLYLPVTFNGQKGYVEVSKVRLKKK